MKHGCSNIISKRGNKEIANKFLELSRAHCNVYRARQQINYTRWKKERTRVNIRSLLLIKTFLCPLSQLAAILLTNFPRTTMHPHKHPQSTNHWTQRREVNEPANLPRNPGERVNLVTDARQPVETIAKLAPNFRLAVSRTSVAEVSNLTMVSTSV